MVSNLEEKIFLNLKHGKSYNLYCIYMSKSDIYANLKPGKNWE